MKLSNVIRKSNSTPSMTTDVWEDIVWELGILADRNQMIADRCRNMIRWIEQMPRRDERKIELLEYLRREWHDGEPVFEDFERIAGNASKTMTRQNPSKRKEVKMFLKGRKTPFMQDQLKAFKRYLAKNKYSGNASMLYAWAEKCWTDSKYQTKWDLAKSASGTKRGYSCSKALADAYRNLTSEQVSVL